MRWVRRGAVGVLALLVLAGLVLWFMPARVLVERLEPVRSGQLVVQDTRGTVWHGSASGVAWQGAPWGRVGWKLSPWRALLGRLDLQVDIAGPALTGRGRFRDAEGGWRLSDAVAETDAAPIQGLFLAAGLQPTGRLVFSIDEIRVRNRLPVQVHGEVRWLDAALSGAASGRIGEVALAVDTPVEGQVRGVLSDAGGPLAVEGGLEMSWLGYGVDARLQPRVDGLAPVLDRIAQPDGNGAWRLLAEGRWLARRTRETE